jgi:hypothetical protein
MDGVEEVVQTVSGKDIHQLVQHHTRLTSSIKQEMRDAYRYSYETCNLEPLCPTWSNYLTRAEAEIDEKGPVSDTIFSRGFVNSSIGLNPDGGCWQKLSAIHQAELGELEDNINFVCEDVYLGDCGLSSEKVK